MQRGIEVVELATATPTLMMGESLPAIAGGIDGSIWRYPLGVVAGITPFNFPMMVPLWMFPLAIACGNTFVLKPSERTPILAGKLVELFYEAGFPKGVLNLVHGGKDVVNGILENDDIKAVSFVVQNRSQICVSNGHSQREARSGSGRRKKPCDCDAGLSS